ncbi:MAG: ABC transporter ATPase [Bacteroidota bacterium]
MKTHKELSPLTKVWIYQSSRELNAEQVKVFGELAETFVQNWTSHGKPVNGSIELFHDRFIVLFVDEQDEQSCGRSVDASVRFIKELEQELNVTLLDRMLVAYKEGETIVSCALAEFEKLIESGKVNKNTIVFNNTIHSIKEFETAWQVPLSQSWHNRLLPVK